MNPEFKQKFQVNCPLESRYDNNYFIIWTNNELEKVREFKNIPGRNCKDFVNLYYLYTSKT